jgi:hypothetical protein
MMMNDSQRLQLQNMIKTNNVEDQTELIRNLKHSVVLRNEVNNMIMIKARYRDDPEKINMECINECGFLFTYYTEIFNKIKKDEIDLQEFTEPTEDIVTSLWRKVYHTDSGRDNFLKGLMMSLDKDYLTKIKLKARQHTSGLLMLPYYLTAEEKTQCCLMMI